MVFITVPADALALLGAGASAGTVMTKFVSCIYTRQALEGFRARSQIYIKYKYISKEKHKKNK